jgi:hypothetical protein
MANHRQFWRTKLPFNEFDEPGVSHRRIGGRGRDMAPCPNTSRGIGGWARARFQPIRTRGTMNGVEISATGAREPPYSRYPPAPHR